MVTRQDYTAEAIEACKSVLIELVHLLGEFRDHMVLVGGWVPPLLLAQAPEPHVGTIDIDLALDFQRIPEETYQTMLEALRKRGYRQDAQQPFRFFRDVHLPAREPITVEVDFMAGEYGGTGRGRRTQQVQDLRARKARGCDLVFSDPVPVTVEGELPGGGRDRVTVRVASIVPWLVMKGMALEERVKEKDAYDVYYCVRHFPGGPAALVAAFHPHLENRLVREGLGKIRSAFLSVEHTGPKWVADFLDVTDPGERAILQRRTYEVVTAWLDTLRIEPWQSA
jgi:hypothetical protein